jgi:hypothetical protein
LACLKGVRLVSAEEYAGRVGLIVGALRGKTLHPILGYQVIRVIGFIALIRIITDIRATMVITAVGKPVVICCKFLRSTTSMDLRLFG